jgi:hypothetical protein
MQPGLGIEGQRGVSLSAAVTWPAASQPFSEIEQGDSGRNQAAESEERTDMNKVARLLATLAIVLVTVSGCGDLYCGVPKGDNVNVLGQQNG